MSLSAPDPHTDEAPDPRRRGVDGGTALRIAFAFLAAAGVGFVFVRTSGVLLALFTAVLIALLLHGVVSVLEQRTPLPRPAAVATTLFLTFALLVGFVAMTGNQLADQLGSLGERLPQGIERLESEIRAHAWGKSILGPDGNGSELLPDGSQLVGGITGVFGMAFGVGANLVAVAIVAIFITISPRRYVLGLVRLAPAGEPRRRARHVLARLGEALTWWLIARSLSMLVVGVLTLIGLLIVGIEMALALAVIAALFSVIPFVGPILSAVPAILIGFVDGPTIAFWVAVVYVVVQLLESNLITPVIEHRTLSLPPALLVASQLMMGVLFGLLGVLLATPLLVTTITLAEELHVEADDEDEAPGVLGSA